MILIMFGAAPAYAQFTLLPHTDKNEKDCLPILAKYEVDGIMPTSQYLKDATAYQDAVADQTDAHLAKEEATKAYDDVVAENKNAVSEYTKGCKGEKYANNLKECTDLQTKIALTAKDAENAKVEKESAQKTLEEKNKVADEASKKVDEENADPTKLATENDVLGCAIKTGRISLQMIPYFIKYISNYLLSIVGILAVLFIVIGGYMYIYGGLTENKDRGKKFIYHALLGMAIALLSWVIVTIIIAAVTSPPT